jgi:surfeit locus 1 family protein
MLRSAVKPHFLGLLALVILVMVSFTYAGLWQWGVAQSSGSAMDSSISRPIAPLSQVLQPAQAFTAGDSLRRITFSGTYDGADQVLVSGRVLGQQSGYWVVTPVLVTGTGTMMPVVRGFVSSTAGVPRVSGRVTITGVLAPSEQPASIAADGTQTTVDVATLLDRWGGSVYAGFTFMTSEQPSVTGAPVLTFVPPKPATAGFNLLNAGYALQWWVFAGFALFMWFKMVRDDAFGPNAGAPRQKRKYVLVAAGSPAAQAAQHRPAAAPEPVSTPTEDTHV